MRKLIDLDTAIDTVKAMEDKSGKGEIAGFYNAILERVIDKLNDLPSAQSEIIYCKDCKHGGEKPIADGQYWCELHDTFMYYCSDSERRTNE